MVGQVAVGYILHIGQVAVKYVLHIGQVAVGYVLHQENMKLLKFYLILLNPLN